MSVIRLTRRSPLLGTGPHFETGFSSARLALRGAFSLPISRAEHVSQVNHRDALRIFTDEQTAVPNDPPDRALICGIVSLNFRLWGYIGIPTVGPLNPMPILDSDAPCPCADAGVAAHAGEADRIDVEGRIKAGRDGA